MISQKLLRALLRECPHCQQSMGFDFWNTSTACHCGTYVCLHPEATRQLAPIFITGIRDESSALALKTRR